jgi:uncharacterized protein (TIGR00369 family)
LLKNSHLAAVLESPLCGVALLHLRGAFCGCDDLTIFEQPQYFSKLLKGHPMYEQLYEQTMISGEPLPFTLPAWIACAPFEEFLGMVIESAENGRAVLTMPFRVKHAQGKGLMHGGAVTALADTAVAMAVKSLLPEGTHFVTTEFCLKFHAPLRGGVVRAEAHTSWLDERNLDGVAEIYAADGTKTATFIAKFRVKRG